MAAEDFFTRWSQKKTSATKVADAGNASADIPAHPLNEARPDNEGNASPDATVKPLPTQDDVDKLTHDSDYSAFMSQGVDESVKRSAMKKLFTDPHFNIMDGLDIYIDDYNKFEPISPALLASLNHAKALLDPLSQLKTPLMRLLEKIPEKPEQDTLENVPASEGEPTPPAEMALADDVRKEEHVQQQNPQEGESAKEIRESESDIKVPVVKEPGAIRNVDDV
ncbi:DUF3306 domain-containing protein [Herminiimonas aquatilis]|uniref:DUF3306 domain-containing protein n=1 Tax=Herminiimonas aquatilis TaxID=345342 RepID=A0ABW2J8Y1_9BURK